MLILQNCTKMFQKIFKIFLIEDFFFYHRCPVVHLELQYLRELSQKFETALMVYSGAWGKLIHKTT